MRSLEIRFRDFENTFVEVLVISVYRKIGQITVTLARVNFVAPKHVSVSCADTDNLDSYAGLILLRQFHKRLRILNSNKMQPNSATAVY